MAKQSSKPHPESLKEVNSFKITEEIQTFVNELSKSIQEEESDRQSWANKVNELDKLRFGVRKRKTKPWPGAANYSIPLIDADITRLKPSYVNLAFNVSPVVTYVPFGPEDIEPARKREMLMDWRLRTQVELFEPYNYGVDQILGSAGQTVFRTIWKFSTRNYTEFFNISELPEKVQNAIYDPRMTDELLVKILEQEIGVDMTFDENVEALENAVAKFRDGEVDFEIDLLEVKENWPEVIACDVKDDILVPTDTKDIDDARFIDYRFWVTKNELKKGMRDGKYEKFNDSDIDSWANKGSSSMYQSSSASESSKMSIEDSQDMLILMHETCCWRDVNGDDIAERCIATWPDADPNAVLRFIELPYDHGQWPYVQVKRELVGPGFYETRGIPTLDEDFQVGISRAVNQAEDNGTLLNMPERVAGRNLISNPKNRRFTPGEFIEVNGDINQYQTRIHGNAAQSIIFQHAQFLKSWSDNRTAQGASSLSSNTDLPGLGERGKKTAKEVEALVAQQGQAQSLDLMVFQQQMSKLYYQIDALYEQFGEDEFNILGPNEEPIKMSRAQIQGKFSMVPNGRLDNSTPSMRLRASMLAFQIGFQNPRVKQDVLLQDIFADIDPRFAQRWLKSDEEMQQENQQQQQLTEQLTMQSLQKQFQVKKTEDDLEIRKDVTKAALLQPIEGKKFAPG